MTVKAPEECATPKERGVMVLVTNSSPEKPYVRNTKFAYYTGFIVLYKLTVYLYFVVSELFTS